MLRPVSILLVVALLAPTSVARISAEELPLGDPSEVALKTKRQHASYAIGMNFSSGIRADGLKVNIDAMILGIRDGLAGQDPRLSEEQMSIALQSLQQEMEAMHTRRVRTEGAENQSQGQAFLAANAEKRGVKSLPSGLQYQVIERGDGPSPKLKDVIRVHYTGTLIDGTVFDSSVEKGEPFVFQVGGRVIDGWNEAVQLMRVGDRWKLFIPPELAYRERGAGRDIGPLTTLIFEIELLGIEKP